MGEVKRKAATYADVLAAPEHMVAEVVGGELHLSPRPAFPHARVAAALLGELHGPFDRGRGGPGGWIIVAEPELHLGGEPKILAPDLAGWRRATMPTAPEVAFVTLAPDWVCEVLSTTSTAKYDRTVKMPACAREGVGHAWLVDRVDRTLEVYRNHEGQWLQVATRTDDEKVRAEPFEFLEFELAGVWCEGARALWCLPRPRHPSSTRLFEPGLASPCHSPGGALTKSVQASLGP